MTGGTDDERARAFATFIAYGGRYEVTGDTVTHHVETSLFPNWVGTAAAPLGARRDRPPADADLAAARARWGHRVQRLAWERLGDDAAGR